MPPQVRSPALVTTCDSQHSNIYIAWGLTIENSGHLRVLFRFCDKLLFFHVQTKTLWYIDELFENGAFLLWRDCSLSE
jgi:hypothetical protein